MYSKGLELLLPILFLLPFSTQTSEPQFKSCENSGFCSRNRGFALAQDKQIYFFYYVDSTSIKSVSIIPSFQYAQTGESISGYLVNSNNKDFQLKFNIQVYQGGILNMIIEEAKIKSHKRFRVSSVTGFERDNLQLDTIQILEFDDDNLIFKASHKHKNHNIFSSQPADEESFQYTLQFFPFKLTGYLNDKEAFVINRNNFLNMEFERSAKEQDQFYSKVPLDATYLKPPYYSSSNIFQEQFDGFTDQMVYGPRAISLDFELATSYLYGLPEHAAQFELEDTLFHPKRDPYRLYNIDIFKYDINSPQALYGSIPFLLGHEPQKEGLNVGVYWMNAAETWVDLFTPDLTKSNMKRGSYWISETGSMEFIVIMGRSPQSVVRKFADVTGHAQLPQYFTLGYHQSRWSYKSGEEVAELNKLFNDKQIPLDVVWLDIDVLFFYLLIITLQHTKDKEYFTWHPKGFSEESRELMTNELVTNQRKFVTIQDPHIHRNFDYAIYEYALEFQILEKQKTQKHLPSTGKYLVRNPDGEDFFIGKCWPGESVWLDFLQSKVRTFWGSLYDYQVYGGSSEIMYAWNDMNEPSVFEQAEITMPKGMIHYTDEGQLIENREIHNIYGSLMHQATFLGLYSRNSSLNDRPFVLSRSFFAGSQKYGAVWTGDNMATYDQMKISVQMLLSMSISGLGFVGADIGGFYGNPSPTLLAKWHQLGMFYPFMRQHSHQSSQRREPYLQSGEAFKLIKQSIRIRQQIIPYIYTKFYEQHIYGTPVMRPMFMEFPDNEMAPRTNDQFMFGEAYLVKPDCEDVDLSHIATQSIYLPQGTWYDVFTNQKHHIELVQGETLLDYPMPSVILVFARGGSIVPSRERIRKSALLTLRDPFTLTIYLNKEPEQRAEGALYLDDGKSFNYQTQSEYKLLQFEYKEGTISCRVIGNGTHESEYAVLEQIIITGINNQESLKSKASNGAEVIRYDSQGMAIIKQPKLSLSLKEGDKWEVALQFGV